MTNEEAARGGEFRGGSKGPVFRIPLGDGPQEYHVTPTQAEEERTERIEKAVFADATRREGEGEKP